MIGTIAIINYIIAVVVLYNITDDEVWTFIIRDMLASKDEAEQESLRNNEPTIRKIFCWMLLIPGVGLVIAMKVIMSAITGK